MYPTLKPPECQIRRWRLNGDLQKVLRDLIGLCQSHSAHDASTKKKDFQPFLVIKVSLTETKSRISKPSICQKKTTTLKKN